VRGCPDRVQKEGGKIGRDIIRDGDHVAFRNNDSLCIPAGALPPDQTIQVLTEVRVTVPAVRACSAVHGDIHKHALARERMASGIHNSDDLVSWDMRCPLAPQAKITPT
jgi:hypothetical protein